MVCSSLQGEFVMEGEKGRTGVGREEWSGFSQKGNGPSSA